VCRTSRLAAIILGMKLAVSRYQYSRPFLCRFGFLTIPGPKSILDLESHGCRRIPTDQTVIAPPGGGRCTRVTPPMTDASG